MHAATHVVSLSWRETLWRGVASRRARPRCVRPAREPRLVPPLPRCLLSALHGGVTGLRVCLLYVLTGGVAHGPSATPDARRRPTPSRDRGSARVSRRVGSRTARAWGLLAARTVPRARSASRGHSPHSRPPGLTARCPHALCCRCGVASSCILGNTCLKGARLTSRSQSQLLRGRAPAPLLTSAGDSGS